MEDTMDFGDEARRANREALHIAAGDMACPTCSKTGSVITVNKNGSREYECPDCEGAGWMTRAEQNAYFGEGGFFDAEEDQAYLDRQEEDRA